jgi:hypothetical protein
MELLAKDNDIPTQDVHMSIREMIRRGYKENEAAEAHTANISFPRIPQQKWPSTRQDGRFGHHFHLTQIPLDVDVNPQTGFALVYHILLNFAKPTTTYNSKEIIVMTKERFQKMEIELGELCEPIAPLCNSKSDAWNGITRVHLKNPETDGNALLEGTCIFVLELDKETTIAKVARGFDRVAANDELTLKITSKSMSSLPAHKLFESIIRESFKRNKEFEITQVLKNTEQEHAFVIAASLDQRSRILRSAVAVEGEIISPTSTKEKLSTAMIARKNCLVLIAKNLNKASNPEQVERELKTLIGEKNVVNVYFPRAEAGMHTGVANVELLNAHIYKKYAKKLHKIQHQYVRFNPHPRSLDGTVPPPEDTLREWGFRDVNTALVSTVEALENATAAPKQKTGTKDKMSSILKEAIAEGNLALKQELRADMKNLREDVLAEACTYTDIMTQDLRSKIDGQFESIDNQFKALMESLSNTRKMLHDAPQCLALPPPAPRHSN